MTLHFPTPFRHRPSPLRNVNELIAEHLTFGQRAADGVNRVLGSWSFLIVQSCFLIAWIVLNITVWILHWDPYPFILMNLVLSLQAAYTAPVILMSQNRQAFRDRLEAHQDFLLNQKAEEEVRAILSHLAAQDHALEQIYQQLQRLQMPEANSSDVERPVVPPDNHS